MKSTKKKLIFAIVACNIAYSFAYATLPIEWPSMANVFTPIEYGVLDSTDGPSYNIIEDKLIVTNPGISGSFGYTTNLINGSAWGKMLNMDGTILTLPNRGASASTQFNQQGEMYIADYINHIIYAYDKTRGLVSIVNAGNLGINMNQPNDMAISLNRTIYATDPNWGNNTGNIWVFKPGLDGKYQVLQKISENIGTTNGIELSPDEKTLYVNETIQRIIYSFTIQDDGSLNNKKTIVANTMGDVDGMKTDSEGNLYVTTRKTDDRYSYYGIMIYSPQGKLLKEIKTSGSGVSRGTRPTNLTFAGKDGKTVFVTMQDESWSGAGYIESFQNPIAGRLFK